MMLLCATLLWGCSSDKEKEAEPGKIDTMTKEIGQEAVRVIKTPIDKAKAVAEQEEERARKLDEKGNE